MKNKIVSLDEKYVSRLSPIRYSGDKREALLFTYEKAYEIAEFVNGKIINLKL